MRILNRTAIREHALLCSQKIKGGKFTRVSEGFLDDVEAALEGVARSVDRQFENVRDLHPDIPLQGSIVTGDFLRELRDRFDRAVARLIQRRVESAPTVGKTL